MAEPVKNDEKKKKAQPLAPTLEDHSEEYADDDEAEEVEAEASPAQGDGGSSSNLPAPMNRPEIQAAEKDDGDEYQGTPKGGKGSNPMADLYFGMAESTVAESAYVPKSMMRPYNPDDLWQKFGSMRIYEKMLEDDQASICMGIKHDMVIGSGFDIVTMEAGQEEIKRDLEIALNEDPEYPFEEMLEEVLPYKFGFAIGEKIFKQRADGSLTFKKLKTTHPDSWLIETDEMGNVTAYKQRGIAKETPINPDALMHMINNRAFQNPYGTSDMRAAYNAWFAKQHVLRFYAIFLEKSAGPIPVATFDKNATAEDVDKIYNIIKNFQTKTAMTVPDSIKIDFLKSESSGEAYIKGINIFNMFIGRAMYVPDLMGFQGSETGGGSYSLGTEQLKIYMRHILKRRRSLEDAVNRHIVKPIVCYNHGFIDNYPKFKLRPISDDDALNFAKVWIELAKGKLYKPTAEEINHVRRALKFPEDENVELVEAPAALPGLPGAPGAPMGALPPGAMPPKKGEVIPADGDEDAEEVAENMQPADNSVTQIGQDSATKLPIAKKPAKPDPEPVLGQDDDASRDTKVTDAPQEVPQKPEKKVAQTPQPVEADESEEDAEQKNKEYAAKLPPGDYHRRVDFKKLKAAMESTANQIQSETRPIAKEIITDLVDQVEKKKIIQGQKVERISDLKPKYLKRLQIAVKSNLVDAFKKARNDAQGEIFQRNFRTPLPADKFLEFLEAETFQYVGDWAYAITKQMGVKLRQAIQDGLPLSSVLDEMDRELLEMSDASIERYARTKVTEVMNKGRVSFFEESGVVDGYQYSAVLDDRTTPICEGLHGKMFKKGDEPIPPMHFNCRSLLIPITIFEKFEPSKSVNGQPIDTFIDKNKGDGFATK